jgi:hypothetical protein
LILVRLKLDLILAIGLLGSDSGLLLASGIWAAHGLSLPFGLWVAQRFTAAIRTSAPTALAAEGNRRTLTLP